MSSSPGAGTPGTAARDAGQDPDDPLVTRLGCLDIERRSAPDDSSAASFALSCCGRFRSVNQDRVLLDHDDDVRVLGVFDGHGILGENAAMLARALLAAAVRAGTPLVEALATTQDLLVAVADNEHRRDPQWPYDYGTTAAVARVAGDAVDLAWVGDSRIAIFEENARTRAWSWQWSSRDHNPRTNDAEAERLARTDHVTTVDRGGVRIYPGQIMPIEDAVRQKLTLNMSRALGHRVLGRYGVLAQAEVASRRLSPARATCIICGSDGIWDVLDERDLAAILTETLPNGVQAAAETIVLRSDQEWIHQCSGDNMSVVISIIRPTIS